MYNTRDWVGLTTQNLHLNVHDNAQVAPWYKFPGERTSLPPNTSTAPHVKRLVLPWNMHCPRESGAPPTTVSYFECGMRASVSQVRGVSGRVQ